MLAVFLLVVFSPVLLAQKSIKPKKGIKAKSTLNTPCMDVLHLFTASDVPAIGPAEEFVPFVSRIDSTAPTNLPGNGLAQHPMLYIGENCNTMFLVKDGKVIWTYSIGEGPEFDDVWMLSNGNILYSRMRNIALITPDKKVLWQFDCKATAKGSAEHTEIHGCQPIGLDRVMFVMNGLPPKLMVVNIKTGKVEVEHELDYKKTADPNGIHGQFRRARVTAQGTYLVSYLTMGKVVEYDKSFKEIWRCEINSPWAAIRLKNGNTLITNEKDWLTREVNTKGETVWEFNCKTDLPTQYQFNSAPQSCTRLANGNTIFASRGKQSKGPQLIEVTKDKKVVWVLQDWTKVGDASALQVLDDPGIPEIPGQSEH